MNDIIKSGKIRVGIVGAGWVSTMRHIPSFKRDKRAVVSAVLDRNPAKAEMTARKFRIPHYFEKLEDFLQEPLDVVSVCTPPFMHTPVVSEALRAGKHVLVEKPMTMTSGEGKRLEALAAEKNVLLCPAHNFLFSHSMQKAQAILQKGEAGEIRWALGIHLSSWQRRLPVWFNELPGGLFFDEAPHILYLMRHFLGSLKIEGSWLNYNAGDSSPKTERVEARLRGERGNGYMTMWTGAPFSEWYLALFCSRAVLVLDLFRDIFIHLPPEKAHNARDVLDLPLRLTRQVWSGIGGTGIRLARKQLFYGHDVLVRRFLDAVINGVESPVASRTGWEVIGLIEDILHSDKQTVPG